MKARIFAKFLVAVFCLFAIALCATDLLISRAAERNHRRNRTRELTEKAQMLVRAEGSPAFAQMVKAAGARVAILERAHQAPEVEAALHGRTGQDVRAGAEQGSTLFVAVPDGARALQLSAPLSDSNAGVDDFRVRVLQSTALAFIPALIIALYFAQRTSSRLGSIISYAGELANGNFHARLSDITTGELGLLSRKLNDTAAKLERTVIQLQTEHTELEKLERIRKDFVINVSHELRTPLASIQGYTETLMDGAIDDQDNNMRFLSIIRHNAERLARLTADLLALSRIELKTQEFRFHSYRVNDLLADVLDTILPIAEKKQIALKQERAPEDTEAFCDSEALYQILSNLLDNAVKYTPEKGTITVGARPLPARGSSAAMIEISVRDSGIGIPLEDQPRLFERFYRVDKARSRELGGTGLGLAIVKHLVRAHGGEVRVESVMNQGATFFFTLPTEAPPDDQPDSELHPQFTAS